MVQGGRKRVYAKGRQKEATMNYVIRRHPVIAFLTALILGPYLLAAALLVLAIYLVFAFFCVITGNGDVL